jgi:DNA-binding XRE family transcriptional regulator
MIRPTPYAKGKRELQFGDREPSVVLPSIDDPKAVGLKVRYLRSARGIPQKSLGDSINVSESEVALIERGRYPLTRLLLERITIALRKVEPTPLPN